MEEVFVVVWDFMVGVLVVCSWVEIIIDIVYKVFFNFFIEDDG